MIDKKIYILSEKSYKGAQNLAVIKIIFLNVKVDLNSFDALIFTSKNAVKAINNISQLWKSKEIYSIGKGTSEAILNMNVKPTYTATSSYGDNFAKEIIPFLKKKKVLFLRAEIVTSKLNTILLNEGIDLYEKIIYKTVCNDMLKTFPKKHSVIIFSSPSTIECFFKKFTWDSSYKAVAIGEKTASFIPKNIKYTISNEQTITSCIKLAKNLL